MTIGGVRVWLDEAGEIATRAFDEAEMYRDPSPTQADLLTVAMWSACRHEVPSRDLMLSSVGRIACAVGMGPLKGMSREMVFVRSGLALGLISAVNNPMGAYASPDGENHGIGDSAASDAATANLR